MHLAPPDGGLDTLGTRSGAIELVIKTEHQAVPRIKHHQHGMEGGIEVHAFHQAHGESGAATYDLIVSLRLVDKPIERTA